MGSISHGIIPLAVRYVAERWPYFNASKGRDHIVIAPWDFGASWVSAFPGLERLRFVSHWGLRERDNRYANGDKMPGCPFCGPSYVPGKDFVIPSMLESLPAHKPPSGTPRNTLIFFSGSPTSALREALLKVGEQYAGNASIRIVRSTDTDLAVEMDRSRFCVSPPGAGYGTRA
jgi:hypothetical protein